MAIIKSIALKNKYFGVIFIIISSIIGAGMLALPLVGAQTGYFISVLLLIGVWLLLFSSSLCILELSLTLPLYKNNFNSIAKATLKPGGQLLINLSFLILLYSIVGAYISGGGSLLFALFKPYVAGKISEQLLIILFTAFLGFFIIVSTKTVDYLLRFLMSMKGLFLLIALILLIPHVNLNLLSAVRDKKSLFFTLPIFLVTLCYNVIIPSLVNYVGNEPKLLVRSIFIGSLIPLLLFIGWLTVTLGIVPYEGQNGFHQIITNKESIGGLMLALRAKINNPLIYRSFDAFSNIALWASFLAIGLALFDYIADACNRNNDFSNRLGTGLICFMPPLLFALFFPEGFTYALNFAALAICTLQLILPPLMVYRLRQKPNLSFPYKSPMGNNSLFLIFILGIFLFVLSLTNIINP